MRHVLSKIDTSADVATFNQEELYALKQCQEQGFLDGVRIATMASGKIVATFEHPKLTFKGMKFLYPYIDWRFIIPSVIAAFEVIVIIIQTIQLVKTNAGR